MAISKSITSVRFVFSVPTNILLQNTMKQLVPLLMISSSLDDSALFFIAYALRKRNY